MIPIRRVAGVTAGVVACALTLVAAAPPASAGLPLLARATVSITHDSSRFEVCAVGYVDDGGSSSIGLWVFQVSGARSDGSRIHTLTTIKSATYSEPCYLIPKYGTVGGAFTTTLSYVFSATVAADDSGLTMGDVIASAGGEGTWNPNNANTFGM